MRAWLPGYPICRFFTPPQPRFTVDELSSAIPRNSWIVNIREHMNLLHIQMTNLAVASFWMMDQIILSGMVIHPTLQPLGRRKPAMLGILSNLEQSWEKLDHSTVFSVLEGDPGRKNALLHHPQEEILHPDSSSIWDEGKNPKNGATGRFFPTLLNFAQLGSTLLNFPTSHYKK